jgi:hypothetical protein
MGTIGVAIGSTKKSVNHCCLHSLRRKIKRNDDCALLMPSHDLPSTTLKTVTPEMLAQMRDNDLVSYWKLTIGFDLWHEIGVLGKAIARSRKIKASDKVKALVPIAELELKFKKTRSKEKGGKGVVIVTYDPTKS